MKQFDLQEYLVHPERKVVTRDGREVRIICTDMIGTSLPIIVLVKNPEPLEEKLILYTPEGRAAYLNEGLDLFFADEKPKNKGWMNVYKSFDSYCSAQGDFIFKTEQEAKEAINYSRDVYYVTTVKIEWEE